MQKGIPPSQRSLPEGRGLKGAQVNGRINERQLDNNTNRSDQQAALRPHGPGIWAGPRSLTDNLGQPVGKCIERRLTRPSRHWMVRAEDANQRKGR